MNETIGLQPPMMEGAPSDQERMKNIEWQKKRAEAIRAHNKLQTRWAIAKHPDTKAALAERVRLSWIALGGSMPESASL